MNDIARLPLVAPWRWIQAGWDDFRASWPASLFYGFVFASLVFGISVVSAPMMLDRDTDGIVAALTSVRSCVTTPLIGHATWHAYRETVLPAP